MIQATMMSSYLNCPRCGLSVRAEPDSDAARVCPRCRGRSGQAVPMYRTDRPRPPVPAAQPRTRAA